MTLKAQAPGSSFLLLLASVLYSKDRWCNAFLVSRPCGSAANRKITKPISPHIATCPFIDTTGNFTSTFTISSRSEKTSAVATRLPETSGAGFLISSIRGQPHKYLQRLAKKHGENFIIRPNIVVLNDPAAIRDVLETHNLQKTPQVRKGYKYLFYGNSARSSGGILAAPGKKWIEQRRMTTPALSECVIGNLASKFQEMSSPLFSYLESMAANSDRVEMSSAFTAVTMDNIGNILLGKSFGMCDRLVLPERHKEVPFSAALHFLTDETVRQMVAPNWLLNLRRTEDKVENARKVIDDYLEDCIDSRLKRMKKQRAAEGDGSRRNSDLLTILLEAESNGLITREEVKGQLLTFSFAGYDTLAPTLTYMLWEISQNPELQERLTKEAREALPSRDDFPEDMDMVAKKLPLLDCTFLETNRKHPAAAMGTSRKVGQKPIIVGNGIELPAGTSVLIPPWTLHRNERFWANPESFDPSRFKAGIPTDPYAFQPFSGGQRNCVGARLARAEALFLVATILRRYEVTCESKKEPQDHYSLTRKPRKAIFFKLTNRTD